MTSGNASVALVADICRRMLTLVLAVFYHRITRNSERLSTPLLGLSNLEFYVWRNVLVCRRILTLTPVVL